MVDSAANVGVDKKFNTPTSRAKLITTLRNFTHKI